MHRKKFKIIPTSTSLAWKMTGTHGNLRNAFHFPEVLLRTAYFQWRSLGCMLVRAKAESELLYTPSLCRLGPSYHFLIRTHAYWLESELKHDRLMRCGRSSTRKEIMCATKGRSLTFRQALPWW